MLAMLALAVPAEAAAAAAAARSRPTDGDAHHVSVWGAPPKWWSWLMTESTQVLE